MPWCFFVLVNASAITIATGTLALERADRGGTVAVMAGPRRSCGGVPGPSTAVAVPPRAREPCGEVPQCGAGPAGRGGAGPRWLVVVEVTGRRSGRTISFPAVIADYGNERYLVSMLGEGASWVRNVRAAGGPAALRHGDREPVILTKLT